MWPAGHLYQNFLDPAQINKTKVLSVRAWGYAFKTSGSREFPGSPVVGTPCFHCQGLGLIPGRGTKIPQAALCSQKKNKQTNKTTEQVVTPAEFDIYKFENHCFTENGKKQNS